eukprot:51072-Pyramimonas_sp.AAC.1
MAAPTEMPTPTSKAPKSSKSPSHTNGSRLVIDRPLNRSSERTLRPNSILDIHAVEALFEEHGINQKHVNTVYTNIFRRGVTKFEDIPDIGRKAKELLTTHFVLTTSEVIEHKPAEASTATEYLMKASVFGRWGCPPADNKGAKLLVKLQDGRLVETVIIKHKQHSTVCVSSQ